MSRIQPRLARRIDRLSRRAHAFHRFAHHPLCGPYEAETLRLGRWTRLCRGCLFALAGGIAGLLVGLALPPQPPAVLAVAAASFAAASFAALAAPGQRRRWPKLLTRFAPAALGGATLSCGLAALQLSGALSGLGVIAATLLATRAYRLRGPDRSLCESCPDRAAARTCPGFLPITRREAAFRRLAGRWIREARLAPAGGSARALPGSAPTV